jgi:hypothetical protein
MNEEKNNKYNQSIPKNSENNFLIRNLNSMDYNDFLKKKGQRPKDDVVKNMSNFLSKSKRSLVNCEQQNKYSFKIDTDLSFKFMTKKDLLPKKEKKIILTIIKSHTKIFAINKTFTITERGLESSQKNHDTHYISVGRQQVNDQGIRPNDIMLFPTDPSISRSHFKIFHKDYFDKIEEYSKKRQLLNILGISKGKLNLGSVFYSDISKYFCPNRKVAIEDNGTIYGTYVRLQGFSLESALSNYLIRLKEVIFNVEALTWMNDFSFTDSLEIFFKYDNIQVKEKQRGNKIIIEKNNIEDFQEQRDKLNNFIILGGSCKNKFELLNLVYKKKDIFNSFKDLNEIKLENTKKILHFFKFLQSEKEILKENNFTINDHTPAVFLNSSRSGFNIIRIGGAKDVIEAILEEYQSFPHELFIPNIEIISLEKIFECQKQETNSLLYKGFISKEDFFHNYPNLSVLKDFSILYLIETFGDPCGVMNRINDVLFFSNYREEPKNLKSFSFNLIRGYLIGSHPQAAYNMNSEVEAFLYFNQKLGKWCLTDLTKFLNPQIFHSTDYFGLWVGISEDKKSQNRYTPKLFQVKSGDEIKVSETVMKLELEDN